LSRSLNRESGKELLWMERLTSLFGVLLPPVTWTPGAEDKRGNDHDEQRHDGPHHHAHQQAGPILLLYDELLLSTAVLMVGIPTAEDIRTAITVRAVEPWQGMDRW
jgi:hypothetical protein